MVSHANNELGEMLIALSPLVFSTALPGNSRLPRFRMYEDRPSSALTTM